jgi:hypothetical protein
LRFLLTTQFLMPLTLVVAILNSHFFHLKDVSVNEGLSKKT